MSWLERALAIEGWMEEEELLWLHDKASQMQNVLEVGCWKGRSTAALAEGCVGQVYTVDHFSGSPDELNGAHREAAEGVNLYAIAQNNLPYAHLSILNMPSRSAARLFKERSLDMVFIDGDHSLAGALSDLMLWIPKVRWLLCGHDREFEGVKQALITASIPWEEGPGSLWYMRLRG